MTEVRVGAEQVSRSTFAMKHRTTLRAVFFLAVDENVAENSRALRQDSMFMRLFALGHLGHPTEE